MTIPASLAALAERWASARAAERANAQSYLIELCTALELEPPRPAGSGYEFEYPIRIGARDGSETQGFIDCYKAGHFVLEAKDADAGATDAALKKAFGQARLYALNDPPGMAPPYLLVLDVAKTLIVWHRWTGTFGGFQAGHRIDLATLHQRTGDIALLRDIWLQPAARDPRQHAQAVTKDIAKKLADLAAALEGRGFDQERVARFLMRVVFSCFAEDVDLLPRDTFRQTVERAGVQGDPERFARAVEVLWQAMDAGGMFGYESLLRFNGHFFRDAEALPLTREEILLLLEAARADWKDVEPTIFGTLLTRALDAAERHRLGAEYTPREFIERLVRPTVEEPVRERWTAVQAEVLQRTSTRKPADRKAAVASVTDFLAWLRGLTVLDPACGSGNFLYVTMHILKDVELEAQRELEALTGRPELRMQEIGPWNFRGIEVKPWAREIAELTLWIGFHQYWKRHHHVQPPEPVLQDTGTLELRDAVLSWDEIRHVPEKDRPDPTPRIPHPVTGELVPDPAARLPYFEHVNARPAEWPAADFIVGNPPYLGKLKKRQALGDGYVDAIQLAYPSIPPAADYVMLWWSRAAAAVASGRTIRAGLITTNSITQPQNRGVMTDAGVPVLWAIADHPWVSDADGAAVRVAMTVVGRSASVARAVVVDADGRPRLERRAPRLNNDLTAGADVASAGRVPLRASKGLATVGFKTYGEGFVLRSDEAEALLRADPTRTAVVRPFRNGNDLAERPRGVYVIDFATTPLAEAEAAHPVLVDLLRTRVKPDRDANANSDIRSRWWQLGHNRVSLRAAVRELPRLIVTPETTKHRFFRFLPTAVAPEGSLFCIALDDAAALAVLNSRIHVLWVNAAAGKLGVGNDARYNKACFDAFPFPNLTPNLREQLTAAAERLEAARDHALVADAGATMTALYNLLAKVRRGATLTPKERALYALAGVGVINTIHEEIDSLVAAAYGWSWPESPDVILERLVALHDARVEEERAGRVRWLRPEYQVPRFGAGVEAAAPELDVQDGTPAAAPVAPTPWPKDAVGQITALRQLVAEAPLTAEQAAACFVGAPAALVSRHLETLAILGEVTKDEGGRFAGALMAT